MSKSKKETIGIIIGLIIVVSIMGLKFFAGNATINFIKSIFNFG